MCPRSRRRAFLASAGTAAIASVAGCQFLSEDSDPTFTLESVRAYQPDGGTVIVVGTVAKPKGKSGSVTLRSELLMGDDYHHAFVQEYSARGKVGTTEYAMAYEYEPPFFEERTYDVRMKILDGGGPNSNWVSTGEPENGTNASEA